MNRRSYLSRLAGGVALAASAGLAGCSAGVQPTEPLTVADATASPGETVTIPIQAAAARQLRVSDPPSDVGSSGLPVRLGYAETALDPDPHVTWTSRPPTWTWRAAVPVDARLPVRVAGSAPSGEYGITVRSADDESTHTARGVVTVE